MMSIRTISRTCSCVWLCTSKRLAMKIGLPFSTSSRQAANNTRLKDPVKFNTPFPTKYNPKSSANKAYPILPSGFTYNPPASSPSPFETPDIFRPQQERQLIVTAPSLPVLPPPLRDIRPKTYHLSEEEIEEIKELRTNDPYKWNRKALAKKYNCSKFFVGMVAEAPQARKDDMDRRLANIKSQWGLYKRTARFRREKRRDMWLKDD